MKIETLWNARRLRFVSGFVPDDCLDRLKRDLAIHCGLSSDQLDRFEWFYIRARYLGAKPVLIALYDGDAISGVLFLLQKRFGGVSVGLYESPYHCGFGSYLGREADAPRNLQDAATFLLSRRKTLGIAIKMAAPAGADPSTTGAGIRNFDSSIGIAQQGSYLPLNGDIQAILSRFGAKTKRNFRYFRKKAAEQKQYRFLGDLSAAQEAEAVKALNATSARFMSAPKAMYRSRATRGVHGHFSAGLIAADGTWLSYMTGWRSDGIAYLDWQMNKEESNQISFSAVMRMHFIEDEMARGSKAIYFLGGSSKTWDNACEKHEICIWEAARNDVSVVIGRRFTDAIARMRPLNRLRKATNIIYDLAGQT